MLRFYKDLTVLYFITAITGGCAFFFLYYYIDGELISGILGAVCIIIIFHFLFVFLALLRYIKTSRLMSKKCDCKSFIEKSEILFKRKNRKNELFLRTNLSAGYINHGQPEKGISILTDFIPQFSYKGNDLIKVVAYYNNLFSAYLQLKDRENAEKALTVLKTVSEDPKFPKILYSDTDITGLAEKNGYLIKIFDGVYDGAEEFFLKSYINAKNMLEKVASAYTLAQIYINTGNTEKAEQYIAFAAQNGGDTVFAEKARKRDFT